MIARLKELLYSTKSIDCARQTPKCDTSCRMKLVACAIKRQVDRDFSEVKKRQWEDLLDYWADFHRGTYYLPKDIRDEIEDIQKAISLANKQLSIYFKNEEFWGLESEERKKEKARSLWHAKYKHKKR